MVWKRFVDGTGAISAFSGWIAIAAMWLMTALILTEVIARTFFTTSLILTLEVSEWLLLTMILMGVATTLKVGGHIRISLISSHLSERNQHLLLVFLSAIGIAAFAFVASYALDGLVTHYVTGTKSATTFKFPMWWSWVPFFIGSALLALQFLATLVENILSLRTMHERGKGLSPAWFIGLAIVLIGAIGFLLTTPAVSGFQPTLTLGIILFLVFGFILSSLWIFTSLLIVGILGVLIFMPYPIGGITTRIIFNSNANFILTCLPLFILMAELLFRSGASRHLYHGISRWVNRVPGRLLHSNVLACTVFAAVSGSSAATCATIGTVAVPELKKLDYDEGISLGSLAGAGTLGLLIPPSGVFIIYGAMTGESIGQLFLGGVIPGLILSSLFMIYIGIATLRRPSIAGTASRSYSWRERFAGLAEITPVIFVIGMVLGLIYLGISTPTEAAAMGVVAAFITLIIYRSLSWQVLKEASWGALRTGCMLMFIFTGASLLAVTMGYLRIPQYLAAAVEAAGLSKYAVLTILCFVYIALGCLFEGTSMMVLTLPIIYPLILSLGFDGIWFGILLTVLIETAQITPPVGFNLFVLQKISGRDIGFIVKNTIPFFFVMCLMVVILILFPRLALILPTMMIRQR